MEASFGQETLNDKKDDVRGKDIDMVSHLTTAVQDYPTLDAANERGASLTNENEAKTSGSDGPEGAASMDTMLTKFKGLALNKEIHSVIINDPVICPLLILLLDSDSESHLLQSLEILHLLALNPGNFRELGNVLHFYDGLKAVYSNSKFSKEIRDFAQLIHDMVKNRRPVLKARPTANQNQFRGLETPVEKGLRKGENSGNNGGRRNQSVSKQGKCVELYVPHCIFKEKRLRMTEALLTLNGIISITYDMKKCYCLVRAKSYVVGEVLGKTVANLGFECHLVTKVDNNEVMVKMEPDPKLENSLSINDQENLADGRKSPQYLSDSDSETSFLEPQAVATVAGANGGQEKKGWLSSAAGFLQKSFYW